MQKAQYKVLSKKGVKYSLLGPNGGEIEVFRTGTIIDETHINQGFITLEAMRNLCRLGILEKIKDDFESKGEAESKKADIEEIQEDFEAESEAEYEIEVEEIQEDFEDESEAQKHKNKIEKGRDKKKGPGRPKKED